jgi:beta-glucosidase
MASMRIMTLLFIGSFCSSGAQVHPQSPSGGAEPFRPRPVALAEHMADSIVALMTSEEKVALVSGDRHFFLRSTPRLHLQEVFMSDATQGVHIRESSGDADLSRYRLERSTAFPCPLCLAATWNPELASRYAEAIGEECRAGGIGILLGPGMNVYRQAQCGRNFEYFGEDPCLRSRMIEAYVRGVQTTGTVATLKHFIANNTEFYRRRSNSLVDDRALHEIYLPAFEAGVNAGARAVMTSYNLLNGEWCGQSADVIDHLLKRQLGFQWMVMTDWASVYDGAKVVRSGQDLEMPGALALKNLGAMIDGGQVSMTDVNRMVRSILKTYFSMRLDERQRNPAYYATYEHHENVALQTAREGIVLLKNEGGMLPIRPGTRDILLTGSFVDTLAAGGGSAAVAGYDVHLMVDAVRKVYGDGVRFVKHPTEAEIRSASVVFCNVGTHDSEGWDRPFALPDDEEARVQICVRNNPRTVVIVTSGSGIRMTGWSREAKAILYAWYGGQVGNVALAEVLSGTTNPSGKLPMTIEKEFRDSPAHEYLPDGETLYAGRPGDREREHPVFDVSYAEGVFVGYRWYDSKNIDPLYPFGFGLSYTSFGYTGLHFSKTRFSEADTITVSFTVKNVGTMKGAEVAQLYVQDVKSSVARPAKELKGFSKVVLERGASARVRIRLSMRAFAFWDAADQRWRAERGTFKILVGASSRDIRLAGTVELL